MAATAGVVLATAAQTSVARAVVHSTAAVRRVHVANGRGRWRRLDSGRSWRCHRGSTCECKGWHEKLVLCAGHKRHIRCMLTDGHIGSRGAQ